MIGIEYTITTLVGVAGTVGGYISGRRNSGVVTQTTDMLKIQIDLLKDQVALIPALNTRIEVLEDLVTQRANVEEVKQIVLEIRDRLP